MVGSLRGGGGTYLLGAALTYLSVGAFETLLPLHLDRLGLMTSMIGWVLAGTLAATGLLAIPAGRVADRWGYRRAFLLGSVGMAVGGVTLALVQAPWLLLVGALVRGAALALIMIPAEPFLTAIASPGMRDSFFSLNFSLVLFSTMGGNALGGWLPSLFRGMEAQAAYSGPLLIMALASGLALLAFAHVGTIQIQGGDGEEPLRFRALAALRRVQAIVGYSLLMGFGSGLIMPFYSLFLKERYGASPAQAGLILSGISLVTALGVLAGPLVVARIGRVRGVVVTQLLAIPFLLTAAYGPNLLTASLSLFARSAFTNIGRPMVSSVTMDLVPTGARATINGLQRASIYLSRGIGAAAAGMLMQRGSIVLPYPTYAVILAVSAFLFYWWFLTMDRQKTTISTEGGIRSDVHR